MDLEISVTLGLFGLLTDMNFIIYFFGLSLSFLDSILIFTIEFNSMASSLHFVTPKMSSIIARGDGDHILILMQSVCRVSICIEDFKGPKLNPVK